MIETSSERPRSTRPAAGSRYDRLWLITACLAAAAWIADAVTQSPLVPLSLLVLSLSLCGGLLAVQAPRRSTFTTRRFLYGTLCVAAAVLVTVGIGHHIVAGLLTLAPLAVMSPALVRRAWRQVSR